MEKTQDFASAEFPIQTGTDGLNEISSGENIPVSYDGNKREGEGDDNLGLKNIVEVRLKNFFDNKILIFIGTEETKEQRKGL